MSAASDNWHLEETHFELCNNLHYESLLAIGSGTLQQRACFEEGLPHDPQDREYLRLRGSLSIAQRPRFKSRYGTYLPGVTGPHPTCLDELINLPAVHGLIIYGNGERLDMEHSRISEYSRRLDLRHGRLLRSFVWEFPNGARVRLRFERFISAQRRHVMALRFVAEHVSGPPAELRMLGPLDAEVRTNGFDHYAAVEITGEHEPITMRVRTNGGIDVAAAALLTSDRGVLWSVEMHERWVAACGSFVLDPGQKLEVDKYAAMTSSRHMGADPLDAARTLAWDAAAIGFTRLAEESDAVWEERWQHSDIEIDGDSPSQLAIRTALYHLMRGAIEQGPTCGIDAHAGSSENACGRYTWESDIFVLPALLYTRPEVGKALARFRVQSLAGARRNAQRYGCAGARFAYESTPAGDEHCTDWARADHAVHVTADIAYGLFHAHLAAPDDIDLLRDTVAVLVETSRYWCERITAVPEHNLCELLLATGPDEYTPLCRNNAYTNRLVGFSLLMTAFAVQKLARADRAACDSLRDQLGLHDEELVHFNEVATRLRMPYHEARQLVLQSEDFFARAPFDFERRWTDRTRPLGACVSQELLYRSQVLQQPDVLLLMALLPQEFDQHQLQQAYDTYTPLTAHDVPTSQPVHALLAAWLGRRDEALNLWRLGAQRVMRAPGVTAGFPAAWAGAAWQALVFGIAGLRSRMQSEVLHVDPQLPQEWPALRFPLVWNEQPLRFVIDQQRVTIEHRGTLAIQALVVGKPVTLPPGEQREFPLAQQD